MSIKKTSFHSERSARNNQRLRDLQRELPVACTDFFRSIAQTTSALTRLAYAYDLKLFFSYLTDEVPSFANSSPRLLPTAKLDEITVRDIEGYQEYLQQYVRTDEDGPSPSQRIVQNNELGIMRKLSSLRSFFDYLFRNDMVSSNVTTRVRLPKKHDKPILYMESDEIERMMDAVLSGDGLSDRQKAFADKTRERDVAILMMFLGTGIRVSELVGLNIEDIDWDRNAFTVTRKGGDQVILYFSDQLKRHLLAYRDVRDVMAPLDGHEHAFFLSMQKRRITVRAVENLVKKYALIGAPLKRKLSPHKLRSTFGTQMYEQTGDIYLVAELMGHADVNTTRKHYAAMKDQKRREAAMNAILPDVD